MKKTKLFNCTILFLTVFLSHTILSQQDFNQYKTLKSEGTAPKDFTFLTYEKINESLRQNKSELSNSKEKIFLKSINYGIDNLLHSGMVVYGDQVSLYIRSIAEKLLKNKPELFSQLRFYTLKANEANAFSTDQGIVFITTGLISQMTNEAQLAFVLAHEISHYTEKHVVEAFEFHTKKGNKNNINDFSKYSKEKELDADRLGLQMYHEAGYSKEELLPSFDVLMYSYLPFEELEIPKSYYSTSSMFIPDNLFPSEKYEIKAIEDYDDSKSSHPNIKKRKEQIEKEIENYSSWDNNSFLLGEQKFYSIRTICRFENIRTDIINTEYVDALYSIFILEKEYPSSIYLKRMKAQSWLGLTKYKANGKISETLDKTADLEGEIATLHFFIKKLSNEGLSTLALRQVHDIYKANPDDKEIKAIYSHLVNELVLSSKFKLENYSKKNFYEASNEFIQLKTKGPEVDTNSVQKTSSKYDKIKNKKSVENAANFDSTKYYLYGISDIIIDPLFTTMFTQKKGENEIEEKNKSAYENLSYKKQRAYDKKIEEEKLNISASKLIVVEPMVFSYKKNTLDQIKSEKLKLDFSEVITKTADEVEINVSLIDRNHLATGGTDIFNERNALFSFMTQVSSEENLSVFPVDYDLLNDINSKYSTNKILFSWVEHSYSTKIKPIGLFFSIIVYPVLFLYVPISILSGNDTEMNIVVLDIEKGNVQAGTNYYFKDSPKPINLAAHIYSIFHNLKKDKSTN